MGDWVVKGVPLCPLSSSGGAGGWTGCRLGAWGGEDVGAGIGRCSELRGGSGRPVCGFASGPPFHHAAMVLPAQTPRQGRLPASLRDGLRPALTRTLVRQIGSWNPGPIKTGAPYMRLPVFSLNRPSVTP